MILITTPTGNTGRIVLDEALKRGTSVRVLVRNAKKLSPEQRRLCEVVEGDLRDETTLRKAAKDIEAAFFCVPQSGKSKDIPEYYREFSEPAAKIFKECGVQRVVTISGGRGNPTDLGPGGPLAQMEKRFDATGVATRHLRCGLFMETIYWWVPQMKFTGAFSLPLDPNYKVALESAQDIGQTAARWLLDPSWSGQQGVDVQHYESLSCLEIAQIFTKVLGRPIAFKRISGEEFQQTLVKYGVSEAMGQCLKDMYADIENGSLKGDRPVPSPAGLRLEAWAREKLVRRMTWLSVIKSVILKIE